jgi:hypothetical protein
MIARQITNICPMKKDYRMKEGKHWFKDLGKEKHYRNQLLLGLKNEI